MLKASRIFNLGTSASTKYRYVLKDIQHLDCEEAPCCRDNRSYPVPSVNWLLLGTRSKDWSRANSSVDRTKLVLSEETSKGASTQTFQGMLGYCKNHRPLPICVIYENQDSIDEKISTSTETNLSLLKPSRLVL